MAPSRCARSRIRIRPRTAATECCCAGAQQHSLQIYLQGGGPDSIAPLWPETPAPLYYRLPEYDVTLHFRPTDFIQVNSALNQHLVHQALTLLDLKPEDRVLDLFCGLGNFTLPLARHAQQVLGIEADAQLIAGARRNAELNDLGNAEFQQADLYDDAMREAPWNGFGFNKLLLDPPRNGAMEAIKRLPHAGVERIVYVSCYPATLARDAEYLVHVLGFRLAAAGVMDMFPHQPCRVHGVVHPPMTRVESKYHIEVDIPSQTLIVRDPRGQEIMRFRIATARNGVGGTAGQRTDAAWRTLYPRQNRRRPAGQCGFHFAPADGRNLLAGLRTAFPERDWILTRILWLCGLERGKNRLARWTPCAATFTSTAARTTTRWVTPVRAAA